MRLFIAILILGLVFMGLAGPGTVCAVAGGDLERSARDALEDLYADSPDAKKLGKSAKGRGRRAGGSALAGHVSL